MLRHVRNSRARKPQLVSRVPQALGGFSVPADQTAAGSPTLWHEHYTQRERYWRGPSSSRGVFGSSPVRLEWTHDLEMDPARPPHIFSRSTGDTPRRVRSAPAHAERTPRRGPRGLLPSVAPVIPTRRPRAPTQAQAVEEAGVLGGPSVGEVAS